MSFESFVLFSLAVLFSGAVACLVFYLRRFESPRPSAIRYFGLAVVAAFAGYLAGSFAGIAVMCASESSGNLCGIWGAVGTGPVLGGLALWLFGPVYRRFAASP